MSSPDSSSRPDDQRSVSDGDLDVDKKRRRSRRKRGNRNRFRPYDVLGADVNDDEDAVGKEDPPRKTSRSRKSKELPMAPPNTSQFLLDDMEERAEAEHELVRVEERRRVRSISVSSDLLQHSDEASESSNNSGDDEHRDFMAELDEYNVDRISRLSKDQMTREILDKDRTAEVYYDNLVRVNRENERLKKLLRENGIPVEQQEDHNHHHESSKEEQAPTEQTVA